MLLHHDGELSDLARLMDDLGAHYTERIGPFVQSDVGDGYDVVFATPRRILQMASCPKVSRATRIAVLEGDSKTLRSHLRRISVDMMIRRPVHPAALRLFLLHTLYRGPERRNRRRVTIGARVRFRTGLFPHGALLTDFSTRGCRLLTKTPVSRDGRIKLTLPASVTHERAIKLRGQVVRSSPAIDEEGGQHVLAVRFENLSPALLRRLQAILDHHARGPARLPREEARDVDAVRPATRTEAQSDGVADPRVEAPPRGDATGIATGIGDDTDVDTSGTWRDRRGGDRRSYDKRVVALGDQATRVLLGRDISPGGMRVDATSALRVGETLRIALHSSGRNEPVVVQATVLRDDGEDGLVLRFKDVDDERSKALEELIGDLPLQLPNSDDTDTGVVVSEIIEQQSAQA